MNLYSFVGNDGINVVDTFGLEPLAIEPIEPPDIPGSGLVSISVDQFKEWLEKRLNKKLDIKQIGRLSRGCIGLCKYKLGSDVEYPENNNDTKCYREESEAIARKCPINNRKVVFSKQGRYKLPDGPKKNSDGTIPNDSVTHVDPENPGTYNYVTRFSLKQGVRYGWMNHSVFDAAKTGIPQMVSFDDKPPKYRQYPDKMWCTTCVTCFGSNGSE